MGWPIKLIGNIPADQKIARPTRYCIFHRRIPYFFRNEILFIGKINQKHFVQLYHISFDFLLLMSKKNDYYFDILLTTLGYFYIRSSLLQ